MPQQSTLFPYPTLFRSALDDRAVFAEREPKRRTSADPLTLRLQVRESIRRALADHLALPLPERADDVEEQLPGRDRKSTRLNSSHSSISYAVFCLKKKN